MNPALWKKIFTEKSGRKISSPTEGVKKERLKENKIQIRKVEVENEKNGVLAPVPGQPEQAFYLGGLKRLVLVSTLSRIESPDFVRFSFFKVRGLEPGKCYKICVMMLDKPYPGMVPLTNSDGSPFEIFIPEAKEGENSQKIVGDLTKEPLIIPEPQ